GRSWQVLLVVRQGGGLGVGYLDEQFLDLVHGVPDQCFHHVLVGGDAVGGEGGAQVGAEPPFDVEGPLAQRVVVHRLAVFLAAAVSAMAATAAAAVEGVSILRSNWGPSAESVASGAVSGVSSAGTAPRLCASAAAASGLRSPPVAS